MPSTGVTRRGFFARLAGAAFAALASPMLPMLDLSTPMLDQNLPTIYFIPSSGEIVAWQHSMISFMIHRPSMCARIDNIGE